MAYGPRRFNKYPAQREPAKPPQISVVYADPTGRIGYAPSRAQMPCDGREIATGAATMLRSIVENYARRFVGPDGVMWFIPTVDNWTQDDQETASLVAFRQKFR
jgi:hypothetical protein